jgi:hypothetical protein
MEHRRRPHWSALAASVVAARIDPPGAVPDRHETYGLVSPVMRCRGWSNVVHAETTR